MFSTNDLDTPFGESPDTVLDAPAGRPRTTLPASATDVYLSAPAGSTRYYAVSAIVNGLPTLESPVIAASPGSYPTTGTGDGGGGGSNGTNPTQLASGGPVNVEFPDFTIPWTFGSTSFFPGMTEENQVGKVPLGTFPVVIYLVPDVGLLGAAPQRLTFGPDMSKQPPVLSLSESSGAAWSFSPLQLAWSGPGGQRIRPVFSWNGALTPFPDGPVPDFEDGQIRFALAQGFGPSAGFSLGYPDGAASLRANLGAKVKIGASVTALAAWAAPRILLALGAGAVTGGAGTVIMEQVTEAEAGLEMTSKLASFVGDAKNAYDLVIDSNQLVRLNTQAIATLISQTLGPIRQELHGLIGKVAATVSKTVSGVANKLGAGLGKAFSFGLEADIARANATAAPSTQSLTVSPLTTRAEASRLRRASLSRTTAGQLGHLAVGTSATRFTVRGLLTQQLAGGRAVAVLAGRLRDHGVAEIVVAGPGYRAEKLVRVVNHVAGGIVRLPRHRSRGPWTVAVLTEQVHGNGITADLELAPLPVQPRS